MARGKKTDEKTPVMMGLWTVRRHGWLDCAERGLPGRRGWWDSQDTDPVPFRLG